MKILIRDVPGATQADMARGQAATLAVFESAGVSPYDCALAEFKRGTIDCGDPPDDPAAWMTKEESRLAALWDEAVDAGLRACANCAANEEPPGWLKLVMEEDDLDSPVAL